VKLVGKMVEKRDETNIKNVEHTTALPAAVLALTIQQRL
jgi:hypothetical protein